MLTPNTHGLLFIMLICLYQLNRAWKRTYPIIIIIIIILITIINSSGSSGCSSSRLSRGSSISIIFFIVIIYIRTIFLFLFSLNPSEKSGYTNVWDLLSHHLLILYSWLRWLVGPIYAIHYIYIYINVFFTSSTAACRPSRPLSAVACLFNTIIIILKGKYALCNPNAKHYLCLMYRFFISYSHSVGRQRPSVCQYNGPWTA